MNKEEQTFLLERISRELADAAESRWLGSSIARLLEHHMRDLDEWNYCWLDDLLDQRLNATPAASSYSRA